MKDGGPAFPLIGEGPNAPHFAPGMSLRDWFAGQASLIALAAATQRITTRSGKDPTDAEIAAAAYALADAMLAEREKVKS